VQLPSAPDLRRVVAGRQSILSCGGVTLQGTRDLLSHLGAGPQGKKHVVITDLREVRFCGFFLCAYTACD